MLSMTISLKESYFYYIITISVIVSCQNDTSKSDPSIIIDDIDQVTISTFSDYPIWTSQIEDLDFIQLDNNINVSGDVFLLEKTPENWMLVDMRRGKDLYIFDNNGDLNRIISREGNGPGEYSKITSFQASPNSEQIMIYDAIINKSITYDTLGNMLNENYLAYNFGQFLWLDEDKLYLATEHSNVPNEDLHYHFFTTDLSFEIINKQIPYNIDRHESTIASNIQIQKNGKWNILVPILSNHIYRIQNSEVQLAYILDFGSKWPNEEFFEKYGNQGSTELGEMLYNEGYIMYLGSAENAKWLLVHFYLLEDNDDELSFKIYLYRKEDHKIFEVKTDNETINYPQPLNSSIYFDVDTLYWAVSAYELINWTEQQLNQGLQIDKSLTELTAKINENDNPIIVKITMN